MFSQVLNLMQILGIQILTKMHKNQSADLVNLPIDKNSRLCYDNNVERQNTKKTTKEVIQMFNVNAETKSTLFDAFKFAVKSVYRHDTIERKIADIKVGSPVFHNGLKFVKSKSNGKVVLTDGTTYDFITAIKTKLFTI